MSGSLTKEEICDFVRKQWMKYWLECIPESYLAEASDKEVCNYIHMDKKPYNQVIKGHIISLPGIK